MFNFNNHLTPKGNLVQIHQLAELTEPKKHK